MTTVMIRGHQLPVIEHQGQRVVTLAMVDEVHERPEGTARRNFSENRPRFIEAEDYFVRNSYEARQMGITAPNGLTLLTESGYLMLVKSLSDDLAWDVQRQLVRSYFRPTAAAFTLPQNLSEALRLAADLEDQKNQALLERDQAIATKALIGSKREATAMATAANAKREAAKLRDQLGFNCRHATILAVEHVAGGEYGFLGLRRWCKANGVTPETVPDKRYPAGVKAWPAAAWMAVYGIDLSELFAGEVGA